MFLSKRCYWTKKEDILSNGEKLRDNCLKTNTLDNAKNILNKITDIKKNIRIIPTSLNNFEIKKEDISNHISNLERKMKEKENKIIIIIGVILAVIIFIFFFFMQSKEILKMILNFK